MYCTFYQELSSCRSYYIENNQIPDTSSHLHSAYKLDLETVVLGGSDGLITAYKYCQLQSLTYHVILTSITVKYCNYVLLSLAVIAQFLSLPVAGVSQVGFLSSVSDTSFQCILCIPALPHLSSVVTKTKLRKSEKLQKRQLGHKIVVLLVKHTTKHLWRK